MKLASFYEHIDNGGVSIDISTTDDGHNQLLIEMNTQYFGYPDLTSKLHFWSCGERTKKQILEDLGKTFFEAANKV